MLFFPIGVKGRSNIVRDPRSSQTVENNILEINMKDLYFRQMQINSDLGLFFIFFSLILGTRKR